MDEDFVIPLDDTVDDLGTRHLTEDDIWLDSITNFADNMFELRYASTFAQPSTLTLPVLHLTA